MGNIESQPDDNTVYLNIPGKAGRTVKPGDILGDNYRLTALIGRGGMGTVYRCRHMIIGQDYAVKILNPDQVNEQNWQRFQVEGKAIAKLDHPNIVKIFNMGIDQKDCPYYVMELLEGDSLETYLEAHNLLNLKDTLDIFSQLASGLSYAHSHGIVHRDIKPSNIILQKGVGEKYAVKIVDFGLAKLVDRHNQAGQSLTSAGEIFGSPFYMSPEQGMGAEIDARADIYSLGCTLFKTLTGQPPFCGENAFHTILMHQKEAAPSLNRVVNDEVFPQALEDLVHNMLAKRPEDRYQSMEQISHDIERLRRGKTLAKVGINTQKNRVGEDQDGEDQKFGFLQEHWRLAGIACLLITSMAAALILYFKQDRPAPHLSKSEPVQIGTYVAEGETKLRDKAMEKAKADFAKFKRKEARCITVKGRNAIELYFPETSIGSISTPEGFLKEAQGLVIVPAGWRIDFEIKRMDHRYTWANPWILKEIDGDHLNTLSITQENFGDAVPSGTGVQNVGDKPILEMLAIARTWTNLNSVCFREVNLSTADLETLQKFPHLWYLSIMDAENDGSEFARYAFFAKLRRLNIISLKNIEAVMSILHGSQTLKELRLDRSSPSVSALKGLNQCPKLKRLQVEETNLTDAQLLALSQLTNVEGVSIREVPFDPIHLISMRGFKRLDQIVVTNQNWTPWQVSSLRKAFPNCTILDGKSSRAPFDLSN